MNENEEITCINCGGTDFTTEGGFYYCTECQTQSQDVREQVFENIENVPVIQKKITIKKPETGTARNRLTSWETYNYILRGLVEELLALGADEEFEKITHRLWLKYLSKLECVSEDPNATPKLGAAFQKRDADIVYQRKRGRKRKKDTASSLSISEMDDKMKYAERNKQRKLMEKAEYSSLSQTLQSETTSLTNQTLSGLSSDSKSTKSGHIAFTKSAEKELLRHMTKKHLQKHKEDSFCEMTCHKMDRSHISQAYVRGPQILTRSRLYALINLGLLLSQQEMQLSDLLRFCREGHVSYLNYKHFFPDHVENLVDHSVYSHGFKDLPTYDFVKKFTFKLFRFLELQPCDLSPNLIKLCKRYCTELNLPDQIFNMAGNYINKTRPFRLNYRQNSHPNYEGRVMGFIIYVLKVLLSFDDVTEYELSKFARLYNEKNSKELESTELFNFKTWSNYIEYRKLVLKHVHFPTWFLLHPDEGCPQSLYIKFVYDRRDKYEADDQSDIAISSAKKILADIELLQDDENDNLIVFGSSLTPFRSYLDHIKNIQNFKVLDHSLNLELIKDVSNQSVEYLLEPKKYLKKITKNCLTICSNAHPQHKFERINPIKGDLFQSFEFWEEKYHKNFAEQKAETLALEKLTDDILKKHLVNIKNGPDSEKISKPDIILPVDKRVDGIRKSVGRNSKGKFCKKDDPEALPPEKITPVKHGKYHISRWNKTVLKNEYVPSLADQATSQKSEEKRRQIEMAEKEKYLNPNNQKYKYHYVPRMEYWANIKDVSKMTKEKYQEYESGFSSNFKWLLEECARVVEQSTKEIYEEFLNVEMYMNYIYFKRLPVISEPISNHKTIIKMIKHVESTW